MSSTECDGVERRGAQGGTGERTEDDEALCSSFSPRSYQSTRIHHGNHVVDKDRQLYSSSVEVQLVDALSSTAIEN